MKKERQSNFELLRIIAMLMIVCLHYLSKGGSLEEPTGSLSVTGFAAWLIEAFCLIAVNVYVLMSGYFAKHTSFSVKRPLRLWLQVWFYSVLFGVLAMLVGNQAFDIYRIFMYVFPVVTEHYWFATAFLLLTLLSPFLLAGAMQLEKKTFQAFLGMLLLFCCVAKTVIPMQLPWDYAGYDVVWLICPYLTGIYIHRFGIPGFFAKKRNAGLLYIGNALIIFGSMLLLRMVYIKTGSFREMIHYSYSYNDLFCYVGAIALFTLFMRIEIKNNKACVMINKMSSTTFGVYLIHEHVNIRYQWPIWFQCEAFAKESLWLFLLHMTGTVLVVYLVCSVIERMRQIIFETIGRSGKGKRYAGK